jgi:hypothetical protein
MKSRSNRTLSFDDYDVEIARRRRRMAKDRQHGVNLRAAVESTIASLKQPYNYGQLPVRGLFRVGMVLLRCAAMVNVRRIHRYIVKKAKAEARGASRDRASQASEAIVSSLLSRLASHLLRLSGILPFDFSTNW